MKKAWVLSYPLSAQRRLWSDWADAQADLSLRCAHMPFCWFCHEAAHIIAIILPLNTKSIYPTVSKIFLFVVTLWGVESIRLVDNVTPFVETSCTCTLLREFLRLCNINTYEVLVTIHGKPNRINKYALAPLSICPNKCSNRQTSRISPWRPQITYGGMNNRSLQANDEALRSILSPIQGEWRIDSLSNSVPV